MNKNPRRQKGIVLLGLVIFFTLVLMSYVVSGLSVVDIKQHQIESTAKSLHQAKQALIAYAVTYADIDGDANGLPDFPGEYGFLPCPDYNNGGAEGNEDKLNCGATGLPKLGFFPWRTLDLPVLRDGAGYCLLYAVTGEYKNDTSASSNKTQMLNEDTNGMFQIVDNAGTIIQGADPKDRIVAIIIAPGKVLPGQFRNFITGTLCGRDYTNYNAYLDIGGGADNSDVSGTLGMWDLFIQATAASSTDVDLSNPYNDKFLTISRDDIWTAVVNRIDFSQKMTDLTEALAMCLRNYAAVNTLDRLPWPSALTTADYRVNYNYNDNLNASLGYAGRFPFIIDDSNLEIPSASLSDELFVEASCNALGVTSGSVVDLQTPGAEYRVLWENWKDHFFYVVSRGYAPGITTATCGDCITVDSVQRAGTVIFSGSRQSGATRDEPIGADVDTKFEVVNYLDVVNSGNFPDPGGDSHYSTAGANDILFCLTTASPPAVIAC